MQRISFKTALSRGCYAHIRYAADPITQISWRAMVLAELAMIGAEVGEAINEARHLQVDRVSPELRQELADVVLRVASLCELLRIDLTTEVAVKMVANRVRGPTPSGF